MRTTSLCWILTLGGCGSVAHSVGDATEAPGAATAPPGSPGASETCRLEGRPNAAIAASRAVGRLLAGVDGALLYFAGAEASASAKFHVTRLDLGSGETHELGAAVSPTALAAGGSSAFWVDGGQLLHETGMTGATRIVDRRGGLEGRWGNVLAATPRGTLFYARFADAASTLWRVRFGEQPEHIATVPDVVTRLYATDERTLAVVDPPLSSDPLRVFALDAALAPAFEGTHPAPLPSVPLPRVDGFDGTSAFVIEVTEDARASIARRDLEGGAPVTLATAEVSLVPGGGRSASALTIVGEDVVWLESEAGYCHCDLRTGEYRHAPTRWRRNQRVRAVPRRGGEVRTLFSWATDERVPEEDGVKELVPAGCALAVVDGRSHLVAVVR